MYIFLNQTNIWTFDTRSILFIGGYALKSMLYHRQVGKCTEVELFYLFFLFCFFACVSLDIWHRNLEAFRTFTKRFAKFAKCTSLIVFSFLFFSQYLENYLWVNYTPELSNHAFIMSICCIVNEKFRENVPAWEVRFQTRSVVLVVRRWYSVLV